MKEITKAKLSQRFGKWPKILIKKYFLKGRSDSYQGILRIVQRAKIFIYETHIFLFKMYLSENQVIIFSLSPIL